MLEKVLRRIHNNQFHCGRIKEPAKSVIGTKFRTEKMSKILNFSEVKN